MSPRWAAWLRAAHRRLGLTPEAFWALTLLEWRILIAGFSPGGGAMTRRELEALLEAHPGIAASQRKNHDVR